MLDHSVDQACLPAGLPQTIAVNGRNLSLTDLERRPAGLEMEPEIPSPEIRVPTIMIAADHHDWEPAPQASQGRCYMEAPAGDHTGIGKPEIEEIAIDEKTIAQARDGIEEIEQRLLDSRRCGPEVGIGDDHKRIPQHGAKDGLPFQPWQ